MKRANLIIFSLIILLGGLGLVIYFQNNPMLEQVVLDTQPVLPEEPVKNPIVRYPVPEPIATQSITTTAADNIPAPPVDPPLPETLPQVHKSDQSIQAALKVLISNNSLYQLLYLENFIQRFVATVNSLPEKRLPRAHLPIKTPGGKFIVAGTTDAPQISSKNYARYTIYLTLLETVDSDLAVKIYTHFYPLFQTAYEQLGYQNAYFNDRLVYVIEHLLETPNPSSPLQLEQPVVLYTYADPNLEKLSSGQKLLLRMGQKHRTRALKVLENYRNMLINLHPRQ